MSGGQGVGPQGPRASRGRPSGLYRVKGVGLLGPRGSRGRTTRVVFGPMRSKGSPKGSQGVKV